MLIVVTQDQGVINWCRSPQSGAGQWGELVVINAGSSPTATVQLRHALARVGQNQPLCLTGHGNNTELGDAGSGGMSWSWSVQEIAGLLGAELPHNFAAPILIEACATTVTNFSAHAAVCLGQLRQLVGVWIYGYNQPVAITHPFPAPQALDRNVELQATQVSAAIHSTAQ
jgi:hypothetical protein